MSIPIQPISFLDNIEAEYKRIQFDECPGPMLLYTVFAKPKDGAAPALAADELVDIEMICYKGTKRTMVYSVPEKFGDWKEPTHTSGIAPPQFAAAVNPWPNVPLEEAWEKLKKMSEIGIEVAVKSVTLSQIGGTPAAQLPVWSFVLVNERTINVAAHLNFF